VSGRGWGCIRPSSALLITGPRKPRLQLDVTVQPPRRRRCEWRRASAQEALLSLRGSDLIGGPVEHARCAATSLCSGESALVSATPRTDVPIPRALAVSELEKSIRMASEYLPIFVSPLLVVSMTTRATHHSIRDKLIEALSLLNRTWSRSPVWVRCNHSGRLRNSDIPVHRAHDESEVQVRSENTDGHNTR